MKLFTLGKKDTNSEGCGHPVAYLLPLRDDPSNRFKITGMRCTQCGEPVDMSKAPQL